MNYDVVRLYQKLKENDIELTNLVVLKCIIKNPGCSANRQAKFAGMNHTSVTSSVKKLVAKNFIENMPSDDARTDFRYTPTQAGIRFFERFEFGDA